jgi:hypothetical protein
MRSVLVSLTAALCLCFTNSAQAERRMFVIGNDNGYGIDRCLASGAACGAAAAATYCKTHQYSQASSYHKVDREEITGAIPGGAGGCAGPNCDDLVAIVCTR